MEVLHMSQMKNRFSSWLHTHSVPGIIILLALVMAQTGPVLAGTWSTTDSLTKSRYYHTATRLRDGRVLVVGGGITSGVTASAEIYDPGLGTWSDTNPLAVARYFHTATLLRDGRVLVAGGHDGAGSSLDSVEIYDPTGGNWTTVHPLTTTRDKHTATLLLDDRVLVAAGAHNVATFPSEYLDSAEVYDPEDDTWAPAGNLNQARDQHTATRLRNGTVIVAAGYHGSQLKASELYSGPWAHWPPWDLVETRYRHTATLLNDGKVLVTGGRYYDFVYTQRNSAELYNPATSSWALTTPMTSRREEHTATLLRSGKVLVVGGYNRISGYLGSTELYNPADATWAGESALTTARFRHTATTLGNGKVLIAGGSTSAATNSCELYTPDPLFDPSSVIMLLLD
jgi:hypothetical protein